MENYTPFGHSDWQTIVADVKKFASAGKKTAVVSTINGDANVPFYKELANQGIKAEDIPVVAFSVGEEELAGIDTKPLVGHLAAWNYFMSVDTPENKEFIKKWHAFIKNPKRVTNDPMEAHFIGFNMWVQAVEQAGTTDVDAVRQAMYGQKVKNLTGGTAVMHVNHHLSKPVLIGEIQADGQFQMVWKTKGEVVGDAWSDFIPESAKLTADWTYPVGLRQLREAEVRRHARRPACKSTPIRRAAMRRLRLLRRHGHGRHPPDAPWSASSPCSSSGRRPRWRRWSAFAADRRCRRRSTPLVQQLAASDFAAKIAAVGALAATGDPRAVPVLEAMLAGRLAVRRADGRVVISRAARRRCCC